MDIRKFGNGAATERIDKWRAEGKKALGLVCCNVPFEIIHAAGVFPVRLRSTDCKDFSTGEAYIGDRICGFAKAILQRLMDGTYNLDGLVASNSCMQASGIYMNWHNHCRKNGMEQFLFELNPPKVTTPSSTAYFGWDLEDLQKALEDLTGSAITNEMLRNSLDTYNEARRLVKRLYDLHKADEPTVSGEETLRLTLAATEMPIEEYIDLLKEFLGEAEKRKPEKKWAVRVLVAGSALDDPNYVRAIEATGCLVVADMHCFGLHFLRDEIPYDENDVMGSLSKYYLTRNSCPRMTDGSDTLQDYGLNAVKEYRADGVIIEKLSFCDRWVNESAVLAGILEKEGIPSYQIERSVGTVSEGQLGIRIEAFREMLESKY